MELKINDFQTPAPITFNYEELKEAVQAKADEYASVVYTEDKVKDAKKDRAELNTLKDALNSERIRLQKEYMKPFEDYKGKTDELIEILKKPIGLIDKQIKGFEEQQKQEKEEEIKLHFSTLDKPEWLEISKLWNPKWLNKSCSMKSIREELKEKVDTIKNDLATLSNLPEFGFEACEVYKSTLDVNKALNEGKRLAEIQKRKEEEERRRKAEEEKKQADAKEPTPQPPKEDFMNPPVIETFPVRFEAEMTKEQAQELAKWFKDRSITFRAI